MVDRAAIFAELNRRSAVRREAKLPLLNADDMARIRIEAIAVLRRRHRDDFGNSVGGR